MDNTRNNMIINFPFLRGSVLLLLPIFLVNFSSSCFAQSSFKRSEKFKSFLIIGQDAARAEIVNNDIFEIQSDFTVEAQVRFNKPLNPTGGAIFINSVGSSGSSDWGWGFVAIDHRFGFHVCSSQPAQIMANQTDTVSICRWYHLAGVKQGDSIYFYLDGQLKAKNRFNFPLVRTSPGPAQFGYHRPPFQNWFDGNMDEFRFWNVAKTAIQIQSGMNDTLLGTENNLQAYYKFNEVGQGSGILIRNSCLATGPSNNGNTTGGFSNNPRFRDSEVLPFPGKPLVPGLYSACEPGSTFSLVAQAPGPGNFNFNWYQTTGIDTLFQAGPSSVYTTPFLSQTDTFFVSVTDRSSRCESPKTLIPITIHPKPSVTLTSSISAFCNLADPEFLATVSPTGLPGVYNWFRGFTPQPVTQVFGNVYSLPGLTKSDTIWVRFSSNAGCQSDLAKVVVRKKRDTNPGTVLYDDSICTGDRVSFFNASSTQASLFSDSLFTQQIDQGPFSDSLSTNELTASRRFWIRIASSDSLCEWWGGPFPVFVDAYPQTRWPENLDSVLCVDTSLGKKYRVLGAPGSRYFWELSPGGNFMGSNQLDSIQVNWLGLTSSPEIRVRETSVAGCLGPLLSRRIWLDASKPVFHSVSTLPENDQVIRCRFRLQDQSLNLPLPTWRLYRDNELLTALNPSDTFFLDANVSTSNRPYVYYLQSTNACNEVLTTPRFNSIWLSGKLDSVLLEGKLNWNGYESHQNDSIQTTIRLFSGGSSMPSDSVSIASLPQALSTQNSRVFSSVNETTCYRVVHSQRNQKDLSYSNILCLSPPRPLVFPNLVTPNEDEANDFFQIKNLEAYPPAELTIFNRWGKQVFQSAAYKNDWSGESGMYFFRFQLGSIEKSGWITVVK